MVSRVWRAFGLALHKHDSRKLSKERAAALCVAENPDPSALPHPNTVSDVVLPTHASHDYVRRGTSRAGVDGI